MSDISTSSSPNYLSQTENVFSFDKQVTSRDVKDNQKKIILGHTFHNLKKKHTSLSTLVLLLKIKKEKNNILIYRVVWLDFY